MKKLINVLLSLAMVLLCITLTSCDSKQDLTNSKYLGTWKTGKVSGYGQEGELDEEYTLVLKGDGTATFESESESTSCEWKETSDGVKLTGSTKMTLKAEGEELTTKILGVTLTFIKQP